MIQRASNFLATWTTENVNPVAYPDTKGEGEQLARKCQSEAETQGISLDELEDAAGGDLVSYMFDALSEAAREEDARSIEKAPSDPQGT